MEKTGLKDSNGDDIMSNSQLKNVRVLGYDYDNGIVFYNTRKAAYFVSVIDVVSKSDFLYKAITEETIVVKDSTHWLSVEEAEKRKKYFEDFGNKDPKIFHSKEEIDNRVIEKHFQIQMQTPSSYNELIFQKVCQVLGIYPDYNKNKIPNIIYCNPQFLETYKHLINIKNGKYLTFDKAVSYCDISFNLIIVTKGEVKGVGKLIELKNGSKVLFDSSQRNSDYEVIK